MVFELLFWRTMGCRGGISRRFAGPEERVMTERDLEEFADCLRRMKENAGRTYEALAKRTGISGSAVHRYCSGKGVPADFGTAERIAKACGATSEELFELHRLWIRAETAQTRLRAAGTPSGQKDAKGGRSPEEEPESRDDERDPGSADAERKTEEAGRKTEKAGRPAQALLRALSPRWRLVLVAAVGCAVAVAGAMVITAMTSTSTEGVAQPSGEQPLLLSRACPPAMALGEHDECVRELQRLLIGTGGLLEADADFGPGTLRNVVAFQVVAGLRPNGLVDETTKKALYAGGVKMRRWPPQRVEQRIRQVFPEEPDRAAGIARCMSFLDPFYSLPNVNGTRNWGVFQISDHRLEELGGTPLKAFDPEWNIQAARRLWSQNRDFSHWENCDQAYRKQQEGRPSGRETAR
ncbi:helix-turn-helix domain-containing protein [Streptosporangium sp. NPDC051022]|uniref:helix-turn-helix domain-containing protein n=1 Tax=Streptosporangium sp. NPDC051022 TaxID=3155752 RepID=UPI0034321E4C